MEDTSPSSAEPSSSSTPYPTPDDDPVVPEESLAFLSDWTGHHDLEALRSHVLDFWRKNKAKYHTYCCIQQLHFLSPRLPSHPHYPDFLRVMTASSSANNTAGTPLPRRQMIELGCCFGTDLRYLISQGIAPDCIVATDLHRGYYDLGKELYGFPSPTAIANEKKLDLVRTAFGDMAAIDDQDQDAFDVSALGFQSYFDYASCFAIFHVLSADQTTRFLERVWRILKPGGILFGWCVGAMEPCHWARTPNGDAPRFLHNAESLKAVMLEVGFSAVETEFIRRDAAPRTEWGVDNMGRVVFTATK